MKLTVRVFPSEKSSFIELDETTLIEILKTILEVESGIPAAFQLVIHNGRFIHEENSRTLKYFGIKNGDILTVANQSEIEQNPILHNQLEAQMTIQYYKSNHLLLNELMHSNKQLYDAIVAENQAFVLTWLVAQKQQKMMKQLQDAMELQRLQANIMDPENQKKIEEMIKMQRINENLEYAQEEMPETFVKVHMLYIDCSVNGVPIHGFVDTGAQNTIMSKKCAEKCQLTKIMDERFKGIAVGVGTGKIIGKIHAAQLEIGMKYFPCSFTIMDSDSLNVDLILGLDNLRRHKCVIDLTDNSLRIMGGEVKVPFLAENLVRESFHSEGIPPEFTYEDQKSSPKEAKKEVSKPQIPQKIPGVVVPPRPTTENDPKISRLMQEGITREQAYAVLAECGGNLELALAIVIQQKFGF